MTHGKKEISGSCHGCADGTYVASIHGFLRQNHLPGELGGKLKIKGLAAVGTVLSADYSKVTPEGVTDADVTFSWSRQTGEKELTPVGTEKNYTVTQDDLGYKLVLEYRCS